MKKIIPRIIQVYETTSGISLFYEWLESLSIKNQTVVHNRLKRIQLGNFGDCKSVGNGVYELRIHISPGYRIYYGIEDRELIILLCGGSKKTQKQDIKNAQKFWDDYRESKML